MKYIIFLLTIFSCKSTKPAIEESRESIYKYMTYPVCTVPFDSSYVKQIFQLTPRFINNPHIKDDVSCTDGCLLGGKFFSSRPSQTGSVIVRSNSFPYYFDFNCKKLSHLDHRPLCDPDFNKQKCWWFEKREDYMKASWLNSLDTFYVGDNDSTYYIYLYDEG